MVFSFNGIDSLDHGGPSASRPGHAPRGGPDRQDRVLDVQHRRRELRRAALDAARVPDGRPLVHVGLYPRHPATLARSLANYRRSRRDSEDGARWARRPMRALDFQFVAHFATLGSTTALLRAEGLEPVPGFTDQGEPLDLSDEHTAADYLHLVCRPVLGEHDPAPP